MSRDAILRDIRAALGRDGGEEREAAAAVGRRLASPSRHLVPKVGLATGEARKALFIQGLERQSTRVIEVAAPAAIPSALAASLAEAGVPPTIRVGADRFLADLPWDTAPALTRRAGPAEAADTASLSHAVAGVAETGTLVLASGVDNPTSLAFLTETHVIAVAEDAIVGCYEEAFDKIREQCRELLEAPSPQPSPQGERELAPAASSCVPSPPGERDRVRGSTNVMPRAVNLISGASRTGDIGGRIVMGAHGPRRLLVIIYGSKPRAAE